jgi:GTP cyclohydrolase I
MFESERKAEELPPTPGLGRQQLLIEQRQNNERGLSTVLTLERRHVSEEQMHKFAGYAAEIPSAFGLKLNTPATADTPKRFIRALYDATEGYEGDPKLIKAFDTECGGGPDCHVSQVVEGPIQFVALCEHHALPFYGQAYVAYIAHEHIIGISKLTRFVRLFARRFAVQERIGQQIADTLTTLLEPHGVAVYLEARHLCVEMRGGTGNVPCHANDLLAWRIRRKPCSSGRVPGYV